MIVECKECGRDVSTEAAACPYAFSGPTAAAQTDLLRQAQRQKRIYLAIEAGRKLLKCVTQP